MIDLHVRVVPRRRSATVAGLDEGRQVRIESRGIAVGDSHHLLVAPFNVREWRRTCQVVQIVPVVHIQTVAVAIRGVKTIEFGQVGVFKIGAERTRVASLVIRLLLVVMMVKVGVGPVGPW